MDNALFYILLLAIFLVSIVLIKPAKPIRIIKQTATGTEALEVNPGLSAQISESDPGAIESEDLERVSDPETVSEPDPAGAPDIDPVPIELPGPPTVESILAALDSLRIPPEISDHAAEKIAARLGKPIKDIFLALDALAMKIQMLGSLYGSVLGYLCALDAQKTMPRRRKAMIDMAVLYKMTWPLQEEVDDIVAYLGKK